MPSLPLEQAILVTTAAEAPGLLAAQQLIDSRGRKWTLRAGLALCGFSLLALLAAGAGSRGLSLLLLFLARGAIEATFSVLYVYSPEASLSGMRSKTGTAFG